MEAVKANGKSLKLACDELRNDKQVVMQAVMRNGALEFASAENDKEIVLKSLESNPYAYMNASYRLRMDKEIVLKAVSGLLLKCIPSELNDRGSFKQFNKMHFLLNEKW